MAFDMNGLFDAISHGGLAVFVVVATIIILLALVVGFYFVNKAKKKYQQFLCVIFDIDGMGNRIVGYDNAGIFIDGKTGNKRFFLKKANVGLCPDNVPAINDGKQKVVFLQRTGLKNFRYIKISFKENRPELQVTEEDVNWAINSYDRQKKFNNAWLEKYLPYIALAIVSIVIMIVFIYFFKDFDKLQVMSENLKFVAESMLKMQNQTLNYYAQSNPNFVTSGTVLN